MRAGTLTFTRLRLVQKVTAHVPCSSPKKLGTTIQARPASGCMDWTRLHLASNHLPVIAIPLLVLLLAFGWWRRSGDVIRTVLWSLLLLAAAAIAMKFTGDFAAELSTEKLASARAFVDRHERAGDRATTAVFALGLAAGVALFVSRRRRPAPDWALALVLVLGIASSILFAYSANTGGQIGHPELRSR